MPYKTFTFIDFTRTNINERTTKHNIRTSYIYIRNKVLKLESKDIRSLHRAVKVQY